MTKPTRNIIRGLLFGLFALSFALTCRAQSPVSSTALEASHVVSNTPGKLLHLQGYNNKGSAQYIQVIDAASVPGDARAEVSTFTTTGLVAANIGNKYFLISAPTGAFYVWFNLDAGGVDPALAGKTGIAVAIATGDTTAQLATKIAAAVDADAAFVSAAVGDVVTITNAAVGSVTDITAGNSGGAVAVTTQGITASVPVLVITAAANSNFSLTLPVGLACHTGIVVCNSSTLATKTAGSADCFFTAIVQ